MNHSGKGRVNGVRLCGNGVIGGCVLHGVLDVQPGLLQGGERGGGGGVDDGAVGHGGVGRRRRRSGVCERLGLVRRGHDAVMRRAGRLCGARSVRSRRPITPRAEAQAARRPRSPAARRAIIAAPSTWPRGHADTRTSAWRARAAAWRLQRGGWRHVAQTHLNAAAAR